MSDELERVHEKKLSFGGIGKAIFGSKGRVIVNLSLVLTQAGFCCVYVIFMSDNLNG